VKTFATLIKALFIESLAIALCTHWVVGITVELSEVSGSAQLQYCNWVNTFDSSVETDVEPTELSW